MRYFLQKGVSWLVYSWLGKEKLKLESTRSGYLDKREQE